MSFWIPRHKQKYGRNVCHHRNSRFRKNRPWVCDDSDNKGSFVSTVRGAREKESALQYFLNPQEGQISEPGSNVETRIARSQSSRSHRRVHSRAASDALVADLSRPTPRAVAKRLDGPFLSFFLQDDAFLLGVGFQWAREEVQARSPRQDPRRLLRRPESPEPLANGSGAGVHVARSRGSHRSGRVDVRLSIRCRRQPRRGHPR